MSRSVSLRHAISALKRYLLERLHRANDILTEPIAVNVDDCNNQIDELTEIQKLIEVSIQKIEQKDSDWQNLINDLDDDAIKPEHKIYEEVATADTTGYFASLNEAQLTLGRISTQSRKLNRKLAILINAPPDNSDGERDYGYRNAHLSRVKTPKLVLPTFEGDILKWKEFWSIFSCTIHDRDDFSSVEKFSYLLPQLKGRAKQAIDGLLITEQNYDTAIDILKQRFERSDDRIVSMLYSEFKQLARSGTRCEKKRRTFDICERIFRQLILADEDIDSSRALTLDLLSKFPAAMVRDLYRHYKVNGFSKLSEVRSGIEKSISELEATSGLIDDLDSISSSNPSQRKASHDTSPQDDILANRGLTPVSASNSPEIAGEPNLAFSVMATSLEASNPFISAHLSPASNCYFCGGYHFNGDCSKYPTAKQREYRLFQLRRCIRCGRKHNSGGARDQCNNATVKCFHCKTRNDHYSALCPIRY